MATVQTRTSAALWLERVVKPDELSINLVSVLVLRGIAWRSNVCDCTSCFVRWIQHSPLQKIHLGFARLCIVTAVITSQDRCDTPFVGFWSSSHAPISSSSSEPS